MHSLANNQLGMYVGLDLGLGSGSVSHHDGGQAAQCFRLRCQAVQHRQGQVRELSVPCIVHTVLYMEP